jgi:G:T-mismatch repair DNA endonuclease (very short patch repair protein)
LAIVNKNCECGCGQEVKKRFVSGHNNRGIAFSLEHRAKISQGLKGKSFSCKGRPSPLRGRHHSEETKRKISESNKGRVPTEETLNKRKALMTMERREALRLSFTGDKNPTKNLLVREKIRLSKIGGKRSDSHKEIMRQRSKNNWQKEEFVRKQMRAHNIRPNRAEMHLSLMLEGMMPGHWKYVGDGEVIIAGKCPDFINVNGKKLIIELYGDYWHKGQDPKDRARIFEPYGYRTLVIWESELKDVTKVKERINSFVQPEVLVNA